MGRCPEPPPRQLFSSVGSSGSCCLHPCEPRMITKSRQMVNVSKGRGGFNTVSPTASVQEWMTCSWVHVPLGVTSERKLRVTWESGGVRKQQSRGIYRNDVIFITENEGWMQWIFLLLYEAIRHACRVMKGSGFLTKGLTLQLRELWPKSNRYIKDELEFNCVNRSALKSVMHFAGSGLGCWALPPD